MYTASDKRYETMQYNRVGKSGLKLPAISLGMWHNFGSVNQIDNMKQIILTAFDHGITHFDLANNYGPVPGSAEANMGRILKSDLHPYRNEMIISTKAGFNMWKGPYGDGGSKKYLISSLNDSLKRMGLEYVDIFYHHRPDPETPMEETMQTLDQIVRQGKALYVGISNYSKEQTMQAYKILREQKTPFIIHQASYSMLNRQIEDDGLKDFLYTNEIGCIALQKSPFLNKQDMTKDTLDKAMKLSEVAKDREQSLTQMALAWILRDERMTSVLIGVSKPEQIIENLKALDNHSFSDEELVRIDHILNDIEEEEEPEEQEEISETNDDEATDEILS